jgi:hypothetical protein
VPESREFAEGHRNVIAKRTDRAPLVNGVLNCSTVAVPPICLRSAAGCASVSARRVMSCIRSNGTPLFAIRRFVMTGA